MWNQQWAGMNVAATLQPPLPITTQVLPAQPPLPSAPPPATPVTIAAAAASPYGQYTAAQYAALTAEQQYAIQQHWQQWQTYQQEYAKWHAQYGDQYNREIAAVTATAATYQQSIPTAPQPTTEATPNLPSIPEASSVVKITGAATMYNNAQQFPFEKSQADNFIQISNNFSQAPPLIGLHQNPTKPIVWQQKNQQQEQQQQQQQQQTLFRKEQQQQNQPLSQDFIRPKNKSDDNQRWDEDEKFDENHFYVDSQQNNLSFNNNNNNNNKNNSNNNMNNRNNIQPNMNMKGNNNSFNDRKNNNFSIENNDDNNFDNQTRGWDNENQNQNNERWSRNNDNTNNNNFNINNNNNNRNNNNPNRWGNSRNEGNFGVGQNDRNFSGNRNNNNNNNSNNNMGIRNNRNQGNRGNNNFRQGAQAGLLNRPQQQQQQPQNNQSFVNDRNINRQQQQFNQSLPQERQQQYLPQQKQNQPVPLMQIQHQENPSFQNERGLNRQQQQQQQKQNQPTIPVEMTEEIFDRQFRQWEEQFEEWKRTNANSTDRKMYEYCAAQFETQRKRLIERRDQMRRRKLEQLQIQQNMQVTNANNSREENPSPNNLEQNNEIVEKSNELPVKKPNSSQDNNEVEEDNGAINAANTVGIKRTNMSESECSKPKSLKVEDDKIPTINLDDDDNEDEAVNDDHGAAQPMSGIFNKSGDIPGLDLVDDANAPLADSNAAVATKVNFLSESKIEKPVVVTAPVALMTHPIVENEPSNNLLTQQIQKSSVGNLPIVLEALRDPETLKNILQVLAKVKGLSQQEIGNTGQAPSEQVLQELPGLLQKLQDQRTGFTNAENKVQDNAVHDTSNVSFAEWQRSKALSQGPYISGDGENPNNFHFDGNITRDSNFNNRSNNMNDNAPFAFNRNAGPNFSGRGDNFGGPNSNFGNRRPVGTGNFSDQNPNFAVGGPNFGRPMGGGGPYGPQMNFDESAMNNVGQANRNFDDNRQNTNQRGKNNRVNPFRQNVANRNFNNRPGQNNDFNANNSWKMGNSGRNRETDDDFYKPVKVIDYENTSTATKVFDYTRRAEPILSNLPDEFKPMKTIDYGHSSGIVSRGEHSSTNNNPRNNIGGGNSFRGRKKNNRRRGGLKNKKKKPLNSNTTDTAASASASNANAKNETNSNQLNQSTTENESVSQEQDLNIEEKEQEDDINKEEISEKETENEENCSAEIEENTNNTTTTTTTNVNHQEYTELEQISDSEDNLQDISPDRKDNYSPAPPPPPIFSLPTLPPISVDNIPLFPSVGQVKTDRRPKTHDSNSVQLLYPSVENKNTITIDEIILKPGRLTRPKKICIIMRGPPGSGKSHVAKLIKDKEMEMGGENIRLLSIDDYFMIENDYFEKCPKTGKKLMKKEILYEYDAASEETYMQYLIKSFKKTIADNLYHFIIVDCNNNSLRTLNEFYCHSKDSGFVPYIIDLICDVETCLNRNAHERTERDIRHIIDTWKVTPFHYIKLDVSSLLENVIEMEDAENMAMDNINEKPETADNIVKSPEKKQEEDRREGESNCGFLKSKWETDLNQTEKLARLDGIRKSLGTRKATMEDYLQLEDWEPPSVPIANTGKKRVRWADIEEKRAQEKMRDIGFVVGQTDWKRMMDPNAGNRALNKTKYI